MSIEPARIAGSMRLRASRLNPSFALIIIVPKLTEAKMAVVRIAV